MKYYHATPSRGWYLQPKRNWNGKDKDFEFTILGKSDKTFTLCSDTRRSTTGDNVFLEDTLVMSASQGQKYCTLSVTESLLIAAVTVVQFMLYFMNLLYMFELKVNLPIILEIDNKGHVNLISNWSVLECIRHIDVKKNFMCELKQEGIIKAIQKASEDNSSDLFRKNLRGPSFEKHAKECVGINKHMN